MYLYTRRGIWTGSVVGLKLILAVPASAYWALGKLPELTEQLGKMVEHHRSKSTQHNYPT